MLRYSFDLDQEADAIEAAVEKVLEEGYRTIDIMSEGMSADRNKRDGRTNLFIYYKIDKSRRKRGIGLS